MRAPYHRPSVDAYSRLLGQSFERLTGRPLLADTQVQDPGFAQALFHAPLPLVSHGTQADPVFCYANLAALTLWGMDWDSFTALPSRHSADPSAQIQADRSHVLAQAAARGWVDDYAGLRVSATGQRFEISQTILWTVSDLVGRVQGQAALIGRVTPHQTP